VKYSWRFCKCSQGPYFLFSLLRSSSASRAKAIFGNISDDNVSLASTFSTKRILNERISLALYYMEHLLAPKGAVPIDVPYVGNEEYDSGPFKAYFERRGWERDETGALIFGGRTPDEVVAFLQTWLYFGCLISVFGRVGIAVRTSDFIRESENGDKLVCTWRLPGFIGEWAQREGMSDGPVVPNFHNPKYIRGENIKEYLNWTFWYLGTFGQEAKGKSEIPNDPLSVVKMSIMAMGESLCSALVAIYGYKTREMPTWGPSSILEARLRDSGWCISDSPFFPESLAGATISADYYFGGYTCPRQRGAHNECSKVICHSYQQIVDTKTYTTKHASTCYNGCDHVLGPEKTVEIVGKGGIPVISWRGGTINVSAYAPPTKYVAVSHV
jgi:hypothetical protein